MEPVNLFVGSLGDKNQDKRFTDSVMRYCSGAVNIKWMRSNAQYAEDWNTEKWKVPYEGYKYIIPELVGMTGTAVYVDHGYEFRADVRELIQLVGKSKFAWNPAIAYRPEVVVIKCDLFNWDWWIGIQWMKSSGWNDDDYTRYIYSHGAMRFGTHADWNVRGSAGVMKPKLIFTQRDGAGI
jgi:hypothetical protein